MSVARDARSLPRDYFEIQLRFATKAARLDSCGLDEAVLRCTNFVRRFGLGVPEYASDNDDWRRYTTTLADLTSLDEQIRWTEDFAASLDPNVALHRGQIRCGAFSVHVVDRVLRTHFVPSDRDGVSPLHPTKRARRRIELRAAVDEARIEHPDLLRVRGISWLYNTDSYRSLFPAAHIATAKVRTGTTRFQGSSSWGQFLDHHGQVKPNLRARFLAALDRFDGSEPWLLFPLPTVVVDSPIAVFDE